ncbi:LOW QUALITY PROTEIN: hypothetical protein PHMEG_00032022 [Phytophthora megakarya]|uniref:Uncharacterized protein n=1 Tax=Phytophthora megakarya TaxID=4795 RepID=A0A225UWX4_9STRA|nr:LOW QUALITY PROTEIN: hypothetical protein PHMEG_00032022 [Phytophthora megakarya]
MLTLRLVGVKWSRRFYPSLQGAWMRVCPSWTHPPRRLCEAQSRLSHQLRDRVSDAPQPVTDVETLYETITIKEEGPLSTVQEEAALKEKDSNNSVFNQDVRRSGSPTSSVDSGSQEAKINETQAMAYVAGQVRRWERELRERVLPPRVRYTWPNVSRGFEPWWTAMIVTSRGERYRQLWMKRGSPIYNFPL